MIVKRNKLTSSAARYNIGKILTLFYLIFGLEVAYGQDRVAVMSYNVRYDEALFRSEEPKENDWINRKATQAALMTFHAPDVIGMQEPHIHQVHYFEQNLPGYAWIGVGREDGAKGDEYNPIFYNKKKLELIDWGTFWLSSTPEKPSKSWDAGYTRICTWAEFRLKGKKTAFYVFNTHFDSKGELARRKSAQLVNKMIKEMVGSGQVFLLGDFNFNPDSKAYSVITAEGLKDSRLISQNAAYGPEGTFNGFNFGKTPRHRIDFVFVSDNTRVIRYGVLNDSYDQKFPSDHLPVVVEAEIN